MGTCLAHLIAFVGRRVIARERIFCEMLVESCCDVLETLSGCVKVRLDLRFPAKILQISCCAHPF
jgi:hypothetical protein